MPILTLLLGFLSNNIRPLLLTFATLFSVSGIYYGLVSHFERRAALTIISNQAQEIQRQKRRCNRLTNNFLSSNQRLNKELSHVQHRIYAKKNDPWGNKRLPNDVERLLEQ